MAVLMESRREEVIRALTRHCGDGRLTLDELEERIQEATSATTEDELRHALRELPPLRDEPARRPPAGRGRGDDDGGPAVVVPRPRHQLIPARRDTRDRDKAIGTLITIGGFVLLFNGFFWLALICWFVLPGLVLKNKRGC